MCVLNIYNTREYISNSPFQASIGYFPLIIINCTLNRKKIILKVNYQLFC